MSEQENILAASNLHKSFGRGPARLHVLRGLDLSVRRGEFLAVMGPSGCGKSTLLHVLGLMTPTDLNEEGHPIGTICLNGQVVPQLDDRACTALRRRQIGFVFQRFNLLSVLSARDNVLISLHVRGLQPNGRTDELFEALDIADVADKKPGKMSVGQQQRVAVVRALAHRPALLMADEPTGNLDSGNAAALLELLGRINRQEKQTIIMITHSSEAAAYADRIVYMKDGRIVPTSS